MSVIRPSLIYLDPWKLEVSVGESAGVVVYIV